MVSACLDWSNLHEPADLVRVVDGGRVPRREFLTGDL
jgi:hypothetical protein